MVSELKAGRGRGWGLTLRGPAGRYGKGLSEQRMGLALHTRPRAEYQLSTKVGRFLRPVGPEQHEPHGWDDNASLNNVEFSYTHEAIMQQHRESLLRLGCGTIDALVIHDMEQSSEDVPVRPYPYPHSPRP